MFREYSLVESKLVKKKRERKLAADFLWIFIQLLFCFSLTHVLHVSLIGGKVINRSTRSVQFFKLSHGGDTSRLSVPF